MSNHKTAMFALWMIGLRAASAPARFVDAPRTIVAHAKDAACATCGSTRSDSYCTTTTPWGGGKSDGRRVKPTLTRPEFSRTVYPSTLPSISNAGSPITLIKFPECVAEKLRRYHLPTLSNVKSLKRSSEPSQKHQRHLGTHSGVDR